MLVREFVVYAEQQRAARDRDVILAWQIAALTRGTKGLPKLERLLAQRKEAAPQSLDEQRMNLHLIFGNRRPRG